MAFVFGNQPSLGGQLGSSFGTGLEALARQKLEQVAQRNQEQKLSSAYKNLFPNQQPGMAEALSALEPKEREIAIKNLFAAPGQEAYAEALGLGLPKSNEIGAQKEGFQNPIKPRLTEKQASEIAKMRQKEEHYNRKERAEAFKQTKAERKEFIDKAKAGRQNLQDLNRLEELEKEGLPTAGYNEFLKRSGLDIPALQGASGEEFNKLTANFIRNAKSYYGSRISNFELEAFLKTLPNLSASPEGRKRVISQLKNIARLEIEGGKAARDIIAKNKGIPPLDLLEQVDERISKKADKFAKKFRQDLAKEVPTSQNKLLTAVGAGLGNLVGSISPGGVLGGAIGGYLGGPGGAAAGYGLGGGAQALISKLLGGG